MRISKGQTRQKKKTKNIKPKTNQGDITKINKGTPLIFEKIMGGVVATTQRWYYQWFNHVIILTYAVV